MSELKGLKIKDGVAGNVLTVDENGVAKSSNVTLAEISELENRVSNIEDTLDESLNELKEING